jgi:phage gp36-like protein
MAYVTKEQLISAIADQRLTPALDDDRDNAPDAGLWDQISQDVDRWINGYLERAGIEPPDPPPASLCEAALLYAQCRLFERRNLHERAQYVHDNYLKEKKAWLERIATGKERLSPASSDESEAISSGAIVSEPSKTYRADGGMMV